MFHQGILNVSVPMDLVTLTVMMMHNGRTMFGAAMGNPNVTLTFRLFQSVLYFAPFLLPTCHNDVFLFSVKGHGTL